MKKLITFYIAFFSFVASCYSQILKWSDEILISSTIKIQCVEKRVDNGKVKYYNSSGTGFFFGFDAGNEKEIPVIVTNKHVIKDAYRGILYFKLKDSLGYPIFGQTEKIIIDNFSRNWIFHPDSSIDLAIMPLIPIINEFYQKKGKKLYYATLPEEIIPNDSVKKTLNAIENVTMIGYPYGLRDSVNDVPIVRNGVSATPVYLDYMGKKQFLVDLPVFGGSSGSPILIYNKGIWSPKYSVAPKAGDRIILVGINFATYTRDFDGKILPKISYDIQDSLKVQTNLPLYNLGIIIKSEKLLDFKSYFKY